MFTIGLMLGIFVGNMCIQKFVLGRTYTDGIIVGSIAAVFAGIGMVALT